MQTLIRCRMLQTAMSDQVLYCLPLNQKFLDKSSGGEMDSDFKVHYLVLCMLGKNFSRPLIEILYFSQNTGFGISCKLSPMETICMKSQILFSGRIK